MKKLLILPLSLFLMYPQSVHGEELPFINNQNPSIVADNKTGSVLLDAVSTQALIISSSEDVKTVLKEKVLTNYLETHAIAKSDISELNSTFEISQYDQFSDCVQNIVATAVLKAADGRLIDTVTNTYAIRIETQDQIRVSTLSDNVTIVYGGIFDYASNLNVLPDGAGNLPILSESDNVDVNKEGIYTCNITAYNAKGDSTEVSYTVTVKKSNSQLQEEAKAEEERKAKEEADRIRLEQEQALAQQQAQARLQAQQSYASIATAGGASSIVDYARQFIGAPYVYGGNDPATGVDCSGFTKYVYAHFGITLNRVAIDQASNGTLVSAENAQPGDLVIWSGHAGIYSGNGMMINAENPGAGVRESPISMFMSGSSGTFIGYVHVG